MQSSTPVSSSPRSFSSSFGFFSRLFGFVDPEPEKVDAVSKTPTSNNEMSCVSETPESLSSINSSDITMDTSPIKEQKSITTTELIPNQSESKPCIINVSPIQIKKNVPQLNYTHSHHQHQLTQPLSFDLISNYTQRPESPKKHIGSPSNTIVSPRKIITVKESDAYSKENQEIKDHKQCIFSQKTSSIDQIVDEGCPARFLTNIKKVGEGAMGDVYKAIERSTSKEVAIKRIVVTRKNMNNLINEITIHKKLQHKNIVTFMGSYLDDGYLWCSMEYMDGGSLTDLLNQYEYGLCLNDSQIAFVMKEITFGIAYLHGNHIIHRDIKSDNILISRSGAVKIADFGFAVNASKTNGMVGSPFWMPPEVLLDLNYDNKVDIYSLGIVLFELLDGKPPYYDLTGDELRNSIINKGIPSPQNISANFEFKNVLNWCTMTTPSKRPDCVELLTHRFVSLSCRRDGFKNIVEMVTQ